MNRIWIAVVIIVLLVGGLATLGGFYWQKSAKLEEDLATMGLNFSTLQKVKSGQDELISRLEGELVAANAEVSRLEGELATAEAQVSTLQADLTAAQAEVSALSEELTLIKDPRHFNSLTELENWLEQDDTDGEYADASPFEIVYILQIRALRDGYLLPAHFEDLDLDGIVDYVGNLAYIGDTIYYVWPYDDSVGEWAYVSSIPSHPLPLA